jgi:serine/threonine protein kinase
MGGRDVLQDEIKNLKTLQGGPHIVELYDVYMPISKERFLVMECLRGGELFDRILEKKRFSEAEARQVARGLLEALQYMHSQNIAFHDVKPENIYYLR